ncbi:glycerol dehydratase reactivase beta/small subunit family protein [Brevibacillus brevis]|uniref:Glycerol dehydratase reactivase beta/small subunit family protein n=1 Tax=Brevibacillus brevis TaxID=1393 RepID=A0ABY9T6B7_BREBE|nr:glycerol dehydratase reactivase beta/small subunit family protein [Brevibacillus brevis]WNC13948.1 glycerol dehydratase reactivase beta/small subunit family protein [Brevibacillus brevis]
MAKRDVYVMILFDAHVEEREWLREVCAGLEEEGVPYRLQPWHEREPSAARLGCIAAESSPLQVGIGLDRYGVIHLHHEKLKSPEPYLRDGWQNGRALGKNAGRLVKGLPLYVHAGKKREE